MQKCGTCGKPVEFRFIDGRCVPLHPEGGCSNTDASRFETQVRRSTEGECRKTNCPACGDNVYFIRHNGGSVWIEPPLGPPWAQHGCFADKADKRAAVPLISPELIDRFQSSDRLITGVVCSSEISRDRMKTIIAIAFGDDAPLSVLVRGGADSFLGRLVVASATERQVYLADQPRLCFAIESILAGPEELTGKGRPFRASVADETKKLLAEIKHGPLSKIQWKAIRKFEQRGLDDGWKLNELLAIVPFASGREQNKAVHLAGIMIIAHAEKYGDCSAALKLVQLLPAMKRARFVAWLRAHSPINIDLKRKLKKAYVFKTPLGVQRPFRLDAARITPI